VASVTIDRADVHNAFNEAVMAELESAFRDLANDDAVRAVVLRGTGASFSAGADIHWMKRMVDYTFEENVRDAAHLSNLLQTIRTSPKPVIARVHGAVYGGGVGLVAACDLAVAVESAVFALTEVRLGILPAMISPFVVERIGAGQARRYAITAERFDAAEAHRIGLVCEVAPDEAAMDQRIAFFVNLLKKNGPEAIAACKAVLRDIQPQDWPAMTAITTERIAERRVSGEGQEGLRAFLEKRDPRWVR
jgi:methylglutaconyl-CoA hydratase